MTESQREIEKMFGFDDVEYADDSNSIQMNDPCLRVLCILHFLHFRMEMEKDSYVFGFLRNIAETKKHMFRVSQARGVEREKRPTFFSMRTVRDLTGQFAS